MSTNYSAGQMILFLAIAVIIYFVPNWIASARKHHNANAIFVTNLLLGWTTLGWVAALIWSLTAVKAESSANIEKSRSRNNAHFVQKESRVKQRYVGTAEEIFLYEEISRFWKKYCGAIDSCIV